MRVERCITVMSYKKLMSFDLYTHIVHATHICSVLINKVSVLGSSRAAKVFHLRAENETHADTACHQHTQTTFKFAKHYEML